jgi:hypothetical protein
VLHGVRVYVHTMQYNGIKQLDGPAMHGKNIFWWLIWPTLSRVVILRATTYMNVHKQFVFSGHKTDGH